MQSTILARRRMRPAALGAAATLASLLALTACGSSGTTAASTTPGAAATTITVYGSGSLTSAPLHIAAEKGYFKAVGLDVKIVTSQTGQNLVPLLLNGQATIATLDTPTTITAVGKNIPIVAIAPNEDSEGTARGGIAVVAKDPSITSWASLAGKTVAVNVLQGTRQILVEASMHNAGINPSSVEFVGTRVAHGYHRRTQLRARRRGPAAGTGPDPGPECRTARGGQPRGDDHPERACLRLGHVQVLRGRSPSRKQGIEQAILEGQHRCDGIPGAGGLRRQHLSDAA